MRKSWLMAVKKLKGRSEKKSWKLGDEEYAENYIL